jgi:hypothetical protein
MSFSFNPQKAVDVGFIEGDYRVVSAYSSVASWAKKDGTTPQNIPDNVNVFIELMNTNGDQSAKSHLERYSVGNKENYFPSNDNRNPLPQSPRNTSQDSIPESERGNFVIGSELTKSCAFYTFMFELGNASFPVEIMDSDGLKCLVGLVGHMVGKGAEKKQGVIEKPKEAGAREPRTTPVFTKIIRLPWDTGNSSASTPQAPASTAANAHTGATTGAAAQAAAPTVDKATSKAAAKYLAKVLAADSEKKDSDISDKSELKRALTQVLLKNDVEADERNAIFPVAMSPAFFNEVALASVDVIDKTYAMAVDKDGDIVITRK